MIFPPRCPTPTASIPIKRRSHENEPGVLRTETRRLSNGRATLCCVNSSTRPAASSLRDAGALWLSGYGRQRPLVEMACELLSQGQDGDGIARLAGHPFDDEPDTHAVEEDLRAALRDLQSELPQRETDELMLAALRAMCRRHLRGELSERDLAEWAHRVLGHGGPGIAQPLVDADDQYDLIEDGFAPIRRPDGEELFTLVDVDSLVRSQATSLAQE